MTRKREHTVKHVLSEKTGLYVAGIVLSALIILTTTGVLSTSADTTEVTLIDNETEQAVIEAERAVSPGEKYTGLSKYDTLANGSGMIFIHDTEQTQTYVMRNMNFSIDMVFIDNDCTITTIHSADKPAPNENGEEQHHRYSGLAKYILEVPEGYATKHVTKGDSVTIENTNCSTLTSSHH